MLGGLKPSFRLDAVVEVEREKNKHLFTRILRGRRKTEGGHSGGGAVEVRTELNALGPPKCNPMPLGERAWISPPHPTPPPSLPAGCAPP